MAAIQSAGGGGHYGSVTVGDEARAHLGNDFNYGNKIYIENVRFGNFHDEDADEHGIHLKRATRGGVVAMPGKGIALLSIDGGGLEWFHGLEVLKSLMENVASLKRLEQPQKPCDYFDMIGGTGIGGMIAIMLGRLEMSIEDCVIACARFSKSLVGLDDYSKASEWKNIYKDIESFALEDAIKKILEDTGTSVDELMVAPMPASCKVFVCADPTQEYNPKLLTSYRTQRTDFAQLKHLQVGQAIRATLDVEIFTRHLSVHPDTPAEAFAPPVAIPLNPISALWAEAQEVLVDENQVIRDHVDCIVSLGANPHFVSGNNADSPEVMKSSTGTALTNEAASRAFCNANPEMVKLHRYCRLLFQPGKSANKDNEVPATSAFENLRKCISPGVQLENLKRFLQWTTEHEALANLALVHHTYRPLVPYKTGGNDEALWQQISDYDAVEAHCRRSYLRVKGTCLWIFKNPCFLRWSEPSGTAILCCVGTVGCGKSILASAVIDHLKEKKLSTRDHCIHYYFENCNPLPSSLDDVLRALIKQCLIKMAKDQIQLPQDLKSAIIQAFDRRTPPSTENISGLLRDLINILPGVLYLIDGFDELNEDQLQDFLSILHECFFTNSNHGSKLALFSREALGRGVDIRRRLPHAEHIRLDISHLRKDIATFVDTQVDIMQLKWSTINNEDLLNEIRDTLKAHSQKMFLWIHFQLLHIWRLGKNDDDIKTIIRNLPRGLNDTYARCLIRIDRHDNPDYHQIACKAFRWVAQAKQPLTPRQLREAVSLNPRDVTIQESMILNSCVTEYCANLLTVDIMNHVQFTHISVRQFLQDQNMLGYELAKYQLLPDDDNLSCGKICLAYIAMLHKRKQIVVRKEVQVSTNLTTGLISAAPGASKWLSITKLFGKRLEKKDSLIPFPVPAAAPPMAKLSMHHYFVRFWLHHTTSISEDAQCYAQFELLCLSHDPEIWPFGSNAVNVTFYKQVLDLAVHLDHLSLIRVLHQHLTARNRHLFKAVFEGTRFDMGIRPLHIAATLGHVRTIRYLLQLGCEVDVYDSDGKSPLCWAAENLHMTAVETLLHVGRANSHKCWRIWGIADRTDPHAYLTLNAVLAGQSNSRCFFALMKSEDPYFEQSLFPWRLSQALFAACLRGHRDIAEYLMILGADINFFTKFAYPGFTEMLWGPSLLVAVRERQIGMASLLLDLGAKPSDDTRVEIFKSIQANGPIGQTEMLDFLALFLKHNTLIWKEFFTGELWRAFMMCALEAKGKLQFSLKRNDFVRSVLHLQDTKVEQRLTGSSFDLAQKLVRLGLSIPDDILVRAIELGYLHTEPEEHHIRKELVSILAQRTSARALSAYLETILGLDDGQSLSEGSIEEADHSQVWICYHVLRTSQGRRAGVDKFFDFYNEVFKQLYSERYRDLAPELFDNANYFTIRQHLIARQATYISSRRGVEALSVYKQLSDAKSDGVFSLNFPYGYIRAVPRWVIKTSIVLGLYRWNWRIRRRKALPFSAADIAYAKMVPSCLRSHGDDLATHSAYFTTFNRSDPSTIQQEARIEHSEAPIPDQTSLVPGVVVPDTSHPRRCFSSLDGAIDLGRHPLTRFPSLKGRSLRSSQ